MKKLLIFLSIPLFISCERAKMPEYYFSTKGDSCSNYESFLRAEAHISEMRELKMEYSLLTNRITPYDATLARIKYEKLIKILDASRDVNEAYNALLITKFYKHQLDTVMAINGTIFYIAKDKPDTNKPILESRNDLNKILTSLDSLDNIIGYNE